ARETVTQPHGYGSTGSGINHPHQQGTYKRGTNRTNPANHDADQNQDQNVLAHPDLNRGNRTQQGTGQRSQSGSQSEHTQEQNRHTHPHQGGHLSVGSTGTHQHPSSCFGHEGIQGQRHHQTDRNNHQTEGGIEKVRQEFYRPGQQGRHIQHNGGWAPNHFDHIIG